MTHRFRLLLVCLGLAQCLCGGCQSDETNHAWDIGTAGVDAGHDAAQHADARDAATDPDVRDAATDPDAAPDVADVSDAAPDLPPAMHSTCAPDAGPDATAGCRVQAPDAFGDCATPLGVVFDGTECVPASGCDCQGDDCPAFDSFEACATSCAAEGIYQPAHLPRVNSDETLSCDSYFCQGWAAFCSSADADPTDRYDTLTPNLEVTCSRQEDSYCDIAWIPAEGQCAGDDWCCEIRGAWSMNPALFEQMSRLSLLPTVKPGGCLQLE